MIHHMKFNFFKYYKLLTTLVLLLTGVLFSFKGNSSENWVESKYKTEYVIVLVIDGPRISETFGDSTYQYIPNLARILAPQGVLVKDFKNNGVTHTNPGHVAIATGVYQKIKNNGKELPKKPSMFQYFLKEKKLDSTNAWVIASKGKLSVLGNTKNRQWKNHHLPSQYCGVNGSGLSTAQLAAITFQGYTGKILLPTGELVPAALGIQNQNLENLKLFPNPVSDLLNLINDTEISEVNVFNLLGQKVVSLNPNALISTIDMSNLSPSAYVVEVISVGNRGTYKVIKK